VRDMIVAARDDLRREFGHSDQPGTELPADG
jgi:hypothetical protein